MSRDVAVVAYSHNISPTELASRNEVELLMPVLAQALGDVDLSHQDIGMTLSGSSDFISGEPFSFIWALGAIGAVPPVRESHLEMDGAFALYEAWIRLQVGDIDTALVYAFGKPTQGNLSEILTLQLDPYVVAPLKPSPDVLAGLQAQAMLGSTGWTEKDMARVAWRSSSAAPASDADLEGLLAVPYVVGPLRSHDLPVAADGAAVVILAAGDRARDLCERPAWIAGMDHRMDSGHLGARDLASAVSAAKAAAELGVLARTFDHVELSASYSSQELLLRDALGLGRDIEDGVVAARPDRLDPLMVTGLMRVGGAASVVMSGAAEVALAHASSGPVLQQSLLCLLEGRR
jgi:acetyl-CoA acetyltransferase